MDTTDLFVRRRGLTRRRSRGGPFLMIFGIGAMVGGLGVAALYYTQSDAPPAHRASASRSAPADPVGVTELTAADTTPAVTPVKPAEKRRPPPKAADPLVTVHH